MNITKKWINDINTMWFEDHVTEVEKLSDNMTVIYFHRPKDSAYWMKIILSGSNIIITGDVGEAVFCLTENAEIEKIAGYDMYYFNQKLRCASRGKSTYEHSIAMQDLREWLRETFENYEEKEDRKEIIELYNDLKYLANDVNSSDVWAARINAEYDERISQFDELFESSLWDVGKVTPIEIYAYHEAFKIINEQLKNKSKVSANEGRNY